MSQYNPMSMYGGYYPYAQPQKPVYNQPINYFPMQQTNENERIVQKLKGEI